MEKSFCREFYKNPKKRRTLRCDLVADLGDIGSEGEKGFYRVQFLYQQKSRSIEKLVCIKNVTIDTELHPECAPSEILKKYLLFKEMGFPVVPYLRCTDDNLILMIDMTDGGKFQIFDSHLPKPEGIEIKNIKEIKKEAFEIAEISSEYGISLYHDAYSIIYDQETRTGKLCLLDIGRNTIINDFYNCNRENSFEQVHQFIDCCVL